MSSFLGSFSNLVKGFFSWDIDEYSVLINNFFKTKNINNKRDVDLFCDLYFGFDFNFTPKYIIYNASGNSFGIIEERPKKEVSCLPVDPLTGTNKVDGITTTIESAKTFFGITEESESVIDDNEIITILKENWQKENIPSSSLVQQIWDYVGEEDQSEISSFYMMKLKEAFYYLMKSLLVGEYLILNDFIDQLDSCCLGVQQLPADFEMKYIKESILDFKALIENSYHVIKSAFSTIMDSVCRPEQTVKYAFYVGGVGNRFFFDNNRSTEERFQLAVEALVHVILIDHIFISTPQNIETLHRAAHIIEDIRGFETDDRFLEIGAPILDKIYLMLRQMSEDASEDLDLQTELRFGDNSIQSKLKSRRFYEDDSIPFPFERTGVFRSFDNFNEDANSIEWDYKTSFRNINNQDEFASRNFAIRRDRHQRIREGIKSRTNDSAVFKELEKIIENPSDHKVLTTSLLYHAIRFIEDYIVIDESVPFERKHEVMTFLLDRLDRLVQSYSSCEIVPNKFGLPFIMNYYIIEEDTSTAHVLKPLSDLKYEQLVDTVALFREKQVLYFNSAGLRPTNINFLSRFLEREKANANKQYLEFLRGQEDRLFDRVKTQMEEWGTENEKKLDDFRDEFKEDLEENKDDLQDDLRLFANSFRHELEQQKTSSLQLLGYLGSFIAFVAVATNAFKLPDLTTDDIGKILVVTSSCILSFALMIRAITLPNDKAIKERVVSIFISLLIVAIIATIMIKALFG